MKMNESLKSTLLKQIASFLKQGEVSMHVMRSALLGATSLVVLLLISRATALEQKAPTPGTGQVLSSGLCAVCENICDGPLSHSDTILDASTYSFMDHALRSVSTAAAIDMARALQAAYAKNPGGHFGETYKANESEVTSLATKDFEKQYASSSEVHSLKLIQAGLYTDTAIGLKAVAKAARQSKWLTTYKQYEGVIEEIIQKAAPDYMLNWTQRQAVCEVLKAYKGK